MTRRWSRLWCASATYPQMCHATLTSTGHAINVGGCKSSGVERPQRSPRERQSIGQRNLGLRGRRCGGGWDAAADQAAWLLESAGCATSDDGADRSARRRHLCPAKPADPRPFPASRVATGGTEHDPAVSSTSYQRLVRLHVLPLPLARSPLQNIDGPKLNSDWGPSQRIHHRAEMSISAGQGLGSVYDRTHECGQG
jgi:hypothetical protein